MPTACGYAWPTDLDLVIREEAAVAGVPLAIAYAIIAVESGFSPAARNYNPPVEDSVGLLQLNRIGGQGVGYSVEQLMDPRLNLRVGLPPIAYAYGANWSETIAPYEFIYRVATQSGHPGLVDPGDPRILRVFQAWACFHSGVGQAGPGGSPAAAFVPGPGQSLTQAIAAMFGPGMPVPPGSVVLSGHVGSVPPVIMAVARVVGRQLVYRFGPRTVFRRQLYALSPAGLRSRMIASIDPRVRLMRALRLPFPLSMVRLPPRHRWPRF